MKKIYNTDELYTIYAAEARKIESRSAILGLSTGILSLSKKEFEQDFSQYRKMKKITTKGNLTSNKNLAKQFARLQMLGRDTATAKSQLESLVGFIKNENLDIKLTGKEYNDMLFRVQVDYQNTLKFLGLDVQFYDKIKKYYNERRAQGASSTDIKFEVSNIFFGSK